MSERKKVYLSGPISGLDRLDYMKRFSIAENILRSHGYDVCNPTRTLICRWPWLYRILGYRLTLCYDLWLLMHCDIIYCMPGSTRSKGARIEYDVAANMRLHDMYVMEVDEGIHKWIEIYNSHIKKYAQQ